MGGYECVGGGAYELLSSPRTNSDRELPVIGGENFFLKGIEAQLTFTKGDSGAVTGIIQHNRPGDYPGRKVK